MAKLRSSKPTAPLSAHTVTVLLCGWDALPPKAVDEDDSLFDLFVSKEPGLARHWAQHEELLRAEAARLGIEPAERVGGRVLFFAEAAAVELGSDD